MAAPYRECILRLLGVGMVAVRLIVGARGGVTAGICFRAVLGGVDGVISVGAVGTGDIITLGSAAAGIGVWWTG